MSGYVLNRLSKLPLSPLLKLRVQPFNKIQSCAIISPLSQKHFLRVSCHYNCNTLIPLKLNYNPVMINNYSTEKKSDNEDISPNKDDSVQSAAAKVNQRAKLKQAVRDYGATIIVFHVTISLASLGLFYLAISNGVDAVILLSFLGFPESVITSKVAAGGSTFVIAYAVHKLFAPVRIAITLSVAPFIVRYLRRINWLKAPVKKGS
ncbi:protein FAM210B, mitochondrial [Parasteatoda tepidariorum]|nr:protein FAM210B, mitochondrial [Parasteatoda tepidariorum]